MALFTENLEITAGTAFHKGWVWENDDGSPRDLTGVGLAAEVRGRHSRELIATFDCVGDAEGNLSIHLTNTSSTPLAAHEGKPLVYDVIVSLSEEEDIPLVGGEVYVKRRVTSG